MPRELESLEKALAHTYPIERELGRGGMAIVYLAEDPKLGRKVAVKVIHSTVANTVGADRFLREIEISASLHHPNILQVYDSGRVGDLLYFVMPYVDGETLKGRLVRETQIPLEDALRIATEVAGALDYAHGKGIVHRDVKPANILLSEGHALLADFGVARAFEGADAAELTATGFTVGTPAYMSPEQASGDGQVNARSDIYALGCVLYEMLAGEPPFTGPTPQAILARSLTERVRPVDQIRDIPESVAHAIEIALAKVPADRFTSATDFAAALRGESSTLTGRQRVKAPRPASGRRRVGVIGAVVAVAALAVAGVQLGWFSGDGGVDAPTVSTNRVAVLPFSYTGGSELAHLGEGMATLLSTVLDGVGVITTVDPAAVIGLVAQVPGDAADAEQTRAITDPLGAGRYVRGTIQELGGQITVTASLNDPARAPPELDRATATGDAETEFFGIVNKIAVDLLGAMEIEGAPRDLESISTTSVVSLNDYLRGEAAMRRGDYLAAASALQSAVDEDGQFALAWMRLSYALQYANPAEAVPPAQRAVDLSARLSDRHERLAEALLAAGYAHADEVARLYGEILEDHPNDIDAQFMLADTRLHLGPLYGWPMDSLGAAFDRVLALDANHSEAIYHRPWAAGLDGDFETIGAWTDRLAALGPHPVYSPVYATMRAVAEGDNTGLEEALSSLATDHGVLGPGGDDFLRLLAVGMVSTLRDLETTGRIAERLFDDSARHPDVRAFGHVIRAHQLAGLGKWNASREQIDRAAGFNPTLALESYANLLLSPWAPVERSELQAVRDGLEALDTDTVARSTLSSPFSGFLVPHDGWHLQIRLYLLGALAARLGDREAVGRYSLELARTRSAGSEEGIVGSTLERNVRALDAFDDGRPEAVLTYLAEPGLVGREARTVERTYSSPIFSGALERFRQAEALAALGREREALDIYDSIWMLSSYDLAYLAPAHLEQARIHELRGDTDEAVEHYARFLELWAEADPELQPLVEQVRQQLGLMGGTSGGG